jgi:hypothetical protein
LFLRRRRRRSQLKSQQKRRSHRRRRRRSLKRRMSYFCARSKRAGRSQKGRWRSWRESRRSWSPPCQNQTKRSGSESISE